MKLADGNGLWLFVMPQGSKLWRFRYRHLGKETMLSLGRYPEVSLLEARDEVVETRKLLREISIQQQSERIETSRRVHANNSFEAVAREWLKNNEMKWTEQHAKKLLRRLENHVFGVLGKRPIADISALELLDVLRAIERDDKIETAQRTLHTCKVIFRFAVLTQRIKYNPAVDLEGALKTHKANNYPSIDQAELPKFIKKLDSAHTSELNISAIKMLMLTFVRQGELRQAQWSDFNFKAKEWRVRAETTKMRTMHHVPLSRQTISLLKRLKLIGSGSDYLFPSQQTRRHAIMSENTINHVIHDLGYKECSSLTDSVRWRQQS